MKLDPLKDFADKVTQELRKYEIEFTLSPEKMKASGRGTRSLVWDSISYGSTEIEKVPNDKRGVYAFAVCQLSGVLPPHGYILYIGVAGRNSQRPLRERYKDYLYPSRIRRRPGISAMIGTWSEVLRFFFAPVDEGVSSDQLLTIEKQLINSLMPPFSVGDLAADVRFMKRAFP